MNCNQKLGIMDIDNTMSFVALLAVIFIHYWHMSSIFFQTLLIYKTRASRSVEGLARDPKGETSAWVSHIIFFLLQKAFFEKL